MGSAAECGYVTKLSPRGMEVEAEAEAAGAGESPAADVACDASPESVRLRDDSALGERPARIATVADLDKLSGMDPAELRSCGSALRKALRPASIRRYFMSSVMENDTLLDGFLACIMVQIGQGTACFQRRQLRHGSRGPGLSARAAPPACLLICRHALAGVLLVPNALAATGLYSGV